jgi:hypothetical protein
MNKLCETKPNSEMPKLSITIVITMSYSKKERSMNFQKQSQSNPIKANSKLI